MPPPSLPPSVPALPGAHTSPRTRKHSLQLQILALKHDFPCFFIKTIFLDFLKKNPQQCCLFSGGEERGWGVSLCILLLTWLYLCMKYLLKSTVIFRLSLFVLPRSRDLHPGERSTYADQPPRINILQAADICPDILNR